jgi:hypothetical protein
MIKINSFNLRNGETLEEKYLPKEIEEHKERILQFFKDKGLSISIKINIKDSELIFKNHLEDKGYVVEKCEPRMSPPNILNKLKDMDLELKQSFDKSNKIGVPDFFCFKNKEDWFFAEIKTENTHLSYNQLSWICENNIQTKIFFIKDVGIEREELLGFETGEY